MAAMLPRKENRELLLERSGKSLDYLNQQAGRLPETADVIVRQGKQLVRKCSDAVDHSTDSGKRT